MNDFQAALNRIKLDKYNSWNNESKVDDCNKLQELTDKATPRKVRRFEEIVNGRVDYHRESCDVCDTVLFEYEAPRYCHECGQALDWSEDETREN